MCRRVAPIGLMVLCAVLAGCSSGGGRGGASASAPSTAATATARTADIRVAISQWTDECTALGGDSDACTAGAGAGTFDDATLTTCTLLAPAHVDSATTRAAIQPATDIIVRGQRVPSDTGFLACSWGTKDVDADYISITVSAPLAPRTTFAQVGCDTGDGSTCEPRGDDAFYTPARTVPTTDSVNGTELPVTYTDASSGVAQLAVYVEAVSPEKAVQDDRVTEALRQAAVYLGLPSA